MAFKEVRSGSNLFRPWDSSSENKSIEGTLSENSSTSSLLTIDTENIESHFKEPNIRKCAPAIGNNLSTFSSNPYSLNFPIDDISTNNLQWSRPQTHPTQNLRVPLPNHSSNHSQVVSVMSRPEMLMQPHPSFPFADSMFYEQFQQQAMMSNPAFHEQSLLEASSAITKQWKLQQQKKQRPKRFQCPHCRVSFSNNGQLKGHIRIHTG